MENKKFYQALSSVTDTIKVLQLCLVITIVLAIISGIIVSLWANNKIAENEKYIYVLTKDGKAIGAEYLSLSNNRQYEAQAITRNFLYLFFQVSGDTYEDQILEAFNLGNNSIKELYAHFNNDGWWRKLQDYDLIQTVKIKDLEVIQNSNPYIINAKFETNIRKPDNTSSSFEIEMTFTIEDVEKRTKENTFGLSINKIETKLFKQLN